MLSIANEVNPLIFCCICFVFDTNYVFPTNWSYFDSLNIITTQKCLNHFENNNEKRPLLTILIINFEPQRIFWWSLFHWKLHILGFNLNINFSKFVFLLSELWPFEIRVSNQSKLKYACTYFKYARTCFVYACAHYIPKPQKFIFLGPKLLSLMGPGL